MRKNGYFGIGCLNMKTKFNYGTLFRTAQVLNADFIFLIGKRFKKQSSDTMNASKHIPLYEYTTFKEFKDNLPYGCQIVAIELDKQATNIKDFKHPKSCVYLLGAEDHGIDNNTLKQCQSVVKLPGERSLNVSVAGSIVLYDRINKL